MIFVDTGAWFARIVPSDPQHSTVRSWFDGNTAPLLTSDYCVDETLTLLAARGRFDLAVTAGRDLFDEVAAKLHFVTRPQLQRAFVLFTSTATNGWSFTDCTSKIVIDDLKIDCAASLDAHFRQFGIRVVP